MCLHRSRLFILGTLRRARKVLCLVALSISRTFVDHESTYFLKTVSLCCVVECMYVFAFMLICFDQSFFCFWCHLCCSSHMSGWVCHWKPFWIPVGDSWKKALMEEWVFISDEHTDGQAPIDDPVVQSTDYSYCIPGATRYSKQCDLVPCETTIPRDQIGGTTAPIAVTAQMRLHTSTTAQSLSRTPGIALFQR